MSDRPTWKGILQIAAVRIPVKVYPATVPADPLALHQLHAPCTSRIQQKKSCPTCARDVTGDEIVKGFEFEPGKYVVLLPAELDAIAPPSTRVIDVTHFVELFRVERQMIDRTYYVVPDGPPDGPARQAYDVVRRAMIGVAGIGTLAIYGREYLIAVHPQADAVLLYTLHPAAARRTVDAVDALRTAGAPVPKPALRLAKQVIAAMTAAPFADPHAPFVDGYQAGLRALIAAKIAGQEYVIPPPAPLPAIASLTDALTVSLTLAQAAQQAAKRRAPRQLTRKAIA